MIDWKEIQKNFIEWARTNSGITGTGRHIWLNQNAPQPPEMPYVAMNILSGPLQIGNTDSVVYKDLNDDYYAVGTRSFVIEVNVYGSDSLNIATDLALSIKKPSVIQFFRGKNISVGTSKPNIINFTELLDTVYEDRRLFELNCMTTYCFNSESGTIKTVIAQGKGQLEKGQDNKITIGG